MSGGDEMSVSIYVEMFPEANFVFISQPFIGYASGSVYGDLGVLSQVLVKSIELGQVFASTPHGRIHKHTIRM